MFWRSAKKFRTTWQGRRVEVVVKQTLDDERGFDRDLKLLVSSARTFEQVTRNLNDLAQENDLVFVIRSATPEAVKARMVPPP